MGWARFANATSWHIFFSLVTRTCILWAQHATLVPLDVEFPLSWVLTFFLVFPWAISAHAPHSTQSDEASLPTQLLSSLPGGLFLELSGFASWAAWRRSVYLPQVVTPGFHMGGVLTDIHQGPIPSCVCSKTCHGFKANSHETLSGVGDKSVTLFFLPSRYLFGIKY